jgi:uncharacterized protein (TIGR02996 family)
VSDFPINKALEAAVVAAADDDTPRLAYADWLDEHDDPDRAEFIRVQCRLADLSPADPDWVDLTERQDELAARLKPRYLGLELDRADRFYFGTDLIGNHEEPFRRGFPYFISCQTEGNEWTPKETRRVIAELTRLVRTTTIRGFEPDQMPAAQLAELLAAPVASQLTGFAGRPHAVTEDWEDEFAEFYRVIATHPALRRVKQLYLYGGIPADGVAALAKATALGSVRRMTIQGLDAPKATIDKLTRADWFHQLRHFRVHLYDPAVAEPLTAGLGRLPDLHTLDLPDFNPGMVRVLAGGRFRSLARLMYGGPVAPAFIHLLTRGRFPALVAFEAPRREMKNNAFLELLTAKWLARLRVLNLQQNGIGDKGVAALAAHPVAKSLRVLRLGDNSFGKTGLMAIAKPGAFPKLTTLDLKSYLKRKGTPAELTAFVSALQLPRLRHLDLMGWPLGDAGAKALAASPAFAGLTRLDLSDCKIGDAGAKALLASPHLQNLVELQLNYNSIKTGADALADPAVMPRLGECHLSGNKIPSKSAAKIERDGLYAMI